MGVEHQKIRKKMGFRLRGSVASGVRAVTEQCPSGELQRWTVAPGVLAISWDSQGTTGQGEGETDEGVDLKKVASLCACNTEGLLGSTVYGAGTLKD